MDEYTIHVFAQMVRIIFMKVCNKEWYRETYLILFLTSCGSGGFGRCLHTTTIPATIIDVITTAPAAITAASITIVDCFCLSWFDVSAGVGSSSWLVSSVRGVLGKVMLDKFLKNSLLFDCCFERRSFNNYLLYRMNWHSKRKVDLIYM